MYGIFNKSNCNEIIVFDMLNIHLLTKFYFTGIRVILYKVFCLSYQVNKRSPLDK